MIEFHLTVRVNNLENALEFYKWLFNVEPKSAMLGRYATPTPLGLVTYEQHQQQHKSTCQDVVVNNELEQLIHHGAGYENRAII